jgi:hypothetical protein
MRVKTLIAYVVIAGALPLASSWANEPEPQDAALNGSPTVALTSERSSDQSGLSSDQPMIASAQSSASASSGNSADTNPPVPAQ